MTNDNKTENRRVRFAAIDGLSRDDLALAGEVWLDELFAAPWVSREAMKLGVHLMRYINNPDPAALHYKAIETQCHMIRDDVDRALTHMRTFNAVDAFSMEKDGIRVAMNLTLLQRLRVIEINERMYLRSPEKAGLDEASSVHIVNEDRWAPEPIAEPAHEPTTIAQTPDLPASGAAISPLVALISEHIRAAAVNRIKANASYAA